jgi:heme-degrading monooxygenase HmoA
MLGIDLTEFLELLREMNGKLDTIAGLLQTLVDEQQEPGNSYTVTISEEAWREWTGQNDRP